MNNSSNPTKVGKANGAALRAAKVRVVAVDIGAIKFNVSRTSRSVNAQTTFAAAGLDVDVATGATHAIQNVGTWQPAATECTTTDPRHVEEWLRDALLPQAGREQRSVILAPEAPMWGTTETSVPAPSFEHARFPEELGKSTTHARRWCDRGGSQAATRAGHVLAMLIRGVNVPPGSIDLLPNPIPNDAVALAPGNIYLCEGFSTDTWKGDYKPKTQLKFGGIASRAWAKGVKPPVSESDEADALACAIAIAVCACGASGKHVAPAGVSEKLWPSSAGLQSPPWLAALSPRAPVSRSHWANMLVAAYADPSTKSGWRNIGSHKVTDQEIGEAARRLSGPCPVFGTRF